MKQKGATPVLPPSDTNNPSDAVEALAIEREWSYERINENEISLIVTGSWAEYHLSFTWMSDVAVLHLACAFDLKVPQPRRAETRMLIALINERLWVGHFDLWVDEGIVMFRHAVLAPEMEVSARQCEVAFGSALDTCEQYFQAFQFVVWAGKTAQEALEAAMFTTDGTA